MLRFLSVSILLLFTVQSFGQLVDPVKWLFSSEKVSEKEYLLIYTAKIDKGWTVYSQESNEDGPVPTKITYYSEGVSYDGDGKEIGHKKEGLDSYFDVLVTKFLDDEDFVIKHNVKVNSDVTSVSGFLTFMACDDSNCLPPSEVDFKITVK
ncbi:hypothetical protein [Portibacter lacus]|uniref:Cytochrome C biogenesis protein n=1 Tax=Portibacter lacus TaxID=1099794 RepID=A0AA37SPX7_9BACT|nr:hypothetical protein [Portibacter lacus]GLR16563.1 hypothetical protein GCM10007940_11780 [Portibacter lacus]